VNYVRQILNDDFIMALKTRQNNAGLAGLMFRRPLFCHLPRVATIRDMAGRIQNPGVWAHLMRSRTMHHPGNARTDKTNPA